MIYTLISNIFYLFKLIYQFLLIYIYIKIISLEFYMLILSWDVGIIHLAYCILEYNTQDKLYKIHYWDQINLTNYDENEFKCKFIDKKPYLKWKIFLH